MAEAISRLTIMRIFLAYYLSSNRFFSACFEIGDYLINIAFVEEVFLWDVVEFTCDDHLESFHCIFTFDVDTWSPGELLSDKEWLREKSLDFTSTSNSDFIIFSELIHTEDGDDILEFFVSLEDFLDLTSDGIVIFTDDTRREDSRS